MKRRWLSVVIWISLLATGLAVPGGNRITVHFVKPKGEVRLMLHDAFSGSQSEIQQLMDVLSDNFVLPRPLHVWFMESGVKNAWYSPDKHQVIFSYEFAEFILQDALKNKHTSNEAGEFTAGAVMFTLMHEMAHALIGELGLPVVGREEDAADEFAALLLLDSGNSGHSALASAAEWFGVMSEHQSQLLFWDEHSLDQQRLFNLLLLMYGKDPALYGPAVREVIPAARLGRAAAEYRQKETRWDTLLSPYMRDQ